MSRQAQLGPAWLIGLLLAWSRRETRDSGLGYYRISPMLRDGIPTPARSYEPMGYGGAEIESVGRAVAELELMQRVAVMRYCRPWMIPAINAEFEVPPSTDRWLKHLREALAELDEKLSRAKAA